MSDFRVREAPASRGKPIPEPAFVAASPTKMEAPLVLLARRVIERFATMCTAPEACARVGNPVVQRGRDCRVEGNGREARGTSAARIRERWDTGVEHLKLSSGLSGKDFNTNGNIPVAGIRGSYNSAHGFTHATRGLQASRRVACLRWGTT